MALDRPNFERLRWARLTFSFYFCARYRMSIWLPIQRQLPESFTDYFRGDYFNSVTELFVVLRFYSDEALNKSGVDRVYFDKKSRALLVNVRIPYSEWESRSYLQSKLLLADYLRDAFTRMMKWCHRHSELKINSCIDDDFEVAIRDFLSRDQDT